MSHSLAHSALLGAHAQTQKIFHNKNVMAYRDQKRKLINNIQFFE
jgi:hypothetical protein